MEVCRQEEFALLTLDLDFANLVAYPAGSHHGVFVVRARRLDAATVSTVVAGLLQSGDLDRLRGSLVIVEPGRLRVRGPVVE